MLAHHPDVDAGDLERVVDQGAGWAAALVLAAHTLRTTPPTGPTGTGHAGGPHRRHPLDARLPDGRGVRRLLARTPAGPAGDLPAVRGDLRRRDRDVRAARRPPTCSSRRPRTACWSPAIAGRRQRAVLALPPAAGRAAAAAYRALGAALAGRRPGPRARGPAPPPARGRRGGRAPRRHERRREPPAPDAARVHARAPGYAASGRLVAESLRLVPDAVRDHLPAVTALEALVAAQPTSVRRREGRRRPGARPAASARRPGARPGAAGGPGDPRGVAGPVRAGGRAAAAEPGPPRCCDCQHDGSDDHGAEHDTSGDLASAQRLADARPRRPPAVGGRPGLGATVHVHARRPLRAPGGPPPAQLRGALAARAASSSRTRPTRAPPSRRRPASTCTDAAGLDPSPPAAARSWSAAGRASMPSSSTRPRPTWPPSRRRPHDSLDPIDLVYTRLLKANLLTARGAAGSARRLLDTRGAVPDRLPPFADRHTRLARLQASGRLGDLTAVETEANGLRAVGLPGRRRARPGARRGRRRAASGPPSTR